MRTTPPTRRARTILVALLTGLALTPGAAPARAQEFPASLRLQASAPSTTVTSWGRRVPLALGVFVATTNGAFEIRATRPAYDQPITAVQVDPATGASRPLPAGAVTDWRGVRRFFEVTIRNRTGRVVAARTFPFCPNSGERQRVNDEGPVQPRYPGSCDSFFPFLRGMVWGLDDGWAAGAFGFGGDEGVPGYLVRLRPGRYTATVRIASPYAEFFSIDASGREVTVRLTVRAPRNGRPLPADGKHSRDARAAHAGAPEDGEAAVPTMTNPDPATRPDLAALPAWNIDLERRGKREFLTFAASPWNAGPASLLVEGFRRPGEAVMDAYQYFHDATGAVVGRAPIGTMEYDPRRGHEHWHFLQFVKYSLLDASQREVVVSRKQAYCLAPTDAVDLTVAGTSWRALDLGMGSRCGSPRSLWVRETLFAGWADTYHQMAPGQSLEVTDVPNGRYHVVVQVNPLGAILDRTTENDVATRLVTIKGRPGERRVVVAPWQGVKQ